MTQVLPVIAGFKRSGKDTLTDFILGYRPNLKRYALAQPIKEVIGALLGISQEELETKKDLTLHFPISLEAMNASADIHTNYMSLLPSELYLPYFWEFWNMILENPGYQAEFHKDYYSLVVSPRELLQLYATEFVRSHVPDAWLQLAPEGAIITDVRFDNEAEWFQGLGRPVIQVVRPNTGASADTHVSEQGVSPSLITSTVYNDSSLEDLQQAALAIVNDLKL